MTHPSGLPSFAPGGVQCIFLYSSTNRKYILCVFPSDGEVSHIRIPERESRIRLGGYLFICDIRIVHGSHFRSHFYNELECQGEQTLSWKRVK